AAADHLTPVTLELGGKSPAVVGRGIGIAEAAERILYGKCLNAGQTCIAPDYALVPEESVAAFAEAARVAVAKLYPTMRDNPDYTAIASPRQRERLDAWLEEARSGGARVIEINPAGEDFSGSAKRPPALLLDVPPATKVMREEIFGPLLPVIPYRTLDEAIAYVN